MRGFRFGGGVRGWKSESSPWSSPRTRRRGNCLFRSSILNPHRRFVFIPHGMDEMFYEPQSSLLPELRGIVAKAVLETGEGRARFRERCCVLFTNLFLRLTNRVEELRAELRPGGCQ